MLFHLVFRRPVLSTESLMQSPIQYRVLLVPPWPPTLHPANTSTTQPRSVGELKGCHLVNLFHHKLLMFTRVSLHFPCERWALIFGIINPQKSPSIETLSCLKNKIFTACISGCSSAPFDPATWFELSAFLVQYLFVYSFWHLKKQMSFISCCGGTSYLKIIFKILSYDLLDLVSYRISCWSLFFLCWIWFFNPVSPQQVK